MFSEKGIDRLELERMCLDPPWQLSKQQRFSLVLLSDQMRHTPRDNRFAQPSTDSMNPARLCKLHKHVLQASYFAPLNNKNFKLMCHLFTKVLNVRCHSRKFPIMAFRYMRDSKAVHRNMLQLLCLSLLGNYPACRFRPMGASREAIYRVFDGKSPNIGLFSSLVNHCSELVMHSLREFVVYSISCHPWLKKRLAPLMNLDQFSSIVGYAMDQAREYFDLFISEESSALWHACFQNHPEATKRVLQDLNIRMYPSHKSILAISYRRPHLNPVGFVTANRVKCPLVKIPTPGEIKTAELECQTEDDLTAWITEAMTRPQEEPDLDEVMEPDREEPDEKAGLMQVVEELGLAKRQHKQTKELDLWKYITKEAYRALQAVVQRSQPTDVGAFERCLEWLSWFGVSAEALSYVREILSCYVQGSQSIAKLKTRFRRVHQLEPYAYTLLQCVAELIKEAEAHFSWFELPYHYWQGQMDALRNRFEVTRLHGVILESNLYLVWCDVCKADYSLIRVFLNKNASRKQYNNYYSNGFRDCVVDYDTNEKFCRNKKCTVKGKCGDKPLYEFPLLGRAIYKNGKVLMMCSRCALPMEYVSTQCIVTETGALCSECTDKARANPASYLRLEQKYTAMVVAEARICFKCGKQLVEAFQAHLLPCEGVYLCKWCCKSKWMLRAIKERFEATETITKEELQQFIVQVAKETKLKFKQKNEDRNNQRLKTYKRSQSFKRVRR